MHRERNGNVHPVIYRVVCIGMMTWGYKGRWIAVIARGGKSPASCLVCMRLCAVPSGFLRGGRPPDRPDERIGPEQTEGVGATSRAIREAIDLDPVASDG